MMSKGECGSHGGFCAASGASGGNDGPSQGGMAPFLKAPRSRARIEPIIPCCVNQLLTASLVDDVFKVRGIVVSQVSIVGIIRKAERAPNYILYKIDDMTTKPIDARHWLGRSKSKQELAPCPVGVYAKVLGILRGSAEVRILEVLQIRVLEDMNEFTAHILETVNSHMMLAKAQEEAYGQSAPSSPPEAARAPESREVRPQAVQAEVLRLIRECPHQEGKSVGELQAELGSLSIKVVKDALEYLMIEGHIYPTVDGQHFKSAD